METESILSKDIYPELYNLIINWNGAVNFIYKTDILHKLQSYLKFTVNFASRKLLSSANST